MSAGYSGTPLPRKLGIQWGHRVACLHAPPHFIGLLEPLPHDVELHDNLGTGPAFQVIVLFATSLAQLPGQFAQASARLRPDGGLWVAWPKKAAGVPTDVSENAVRAVALAAGWVDNKVCAIDGTWSGLRCVMRVKDRPKG